jgi:hypothetical protein
MHHAVTGSKAKGNANTRPELGWQGLSKQKSQRRRRRGGARSN